MCQLLRCCALKCSTRDVNNESEITEENVKFNKVNEETSY